MANIIHLHVMGTVHVVMDHSSPCAAEGLNCKALPLVHPGPVTALHNGDRLPSMDVVGTCGYQQQKVLVEDSPPTKSVCASDHPTPIRTGPHPPRQGPHPSRQDHTHQDRTTPIQTGPHPPRQDRTTHRWNVHSGFLWA